MISLVAARDQLGLTQADLAKRSGCNQSTISKLELGERQLTARWAVRLAPALGVQPTDLLAAEVRRVRGNRELMHPFEFQI